MTVRIWVATLLICSCYADEPCPKVVPMKNFKFENYANGIWYGVALYYNDLQKATNCVTLEYTGRHDNGTLTIFNGNVANNTLVKLWGQIDEATDGEHQMNTYFFTEGHVLNLPLYFLVSDSVNYAICYKCFFDEKTKTRSEFAWVWSRTKVLKESVRKEVDDYLKTTTVIDPNRLVWGHYEDKECKLEDGLFKKE